MHRNSITRRLLCCWTSHSRSIDDSKMIHHPIRIQMLPSCNRTSIHNIPCSKRNHHPHRNQMQPNCSHKMAQELAWAKEKAKGLVMVMVRGHCILAVLGPSQLNPRLSHCEWKTRNCQHHPARCLDLGPNRSTGMTRKQHLGWSWCPSQNRLRRWMDTD
jgi:hypothetical protein